MRIEPEEGGPVMESTVSSSLRDDVVRILTDLVSLESVNPYFPGGERGESSIAAYVAQYGQALNLEIREQPVLPHRANILVSLKVPSADRTLLFDAHMDTVSLDAMGSAGLHPGIRDGTLTGRGSCDDKASLTAMLLAMRALAHNPAGLQTNVLLLASVDEEYLMRGAEAFARSGLHVDGAIVGEPTGLAIVPAHKGFVRWKLHTIGRAAHSSNPQLGDNAIYQMAELLQLLQPRLNAALAKRVHPLVGQATWSVGKISGGASVNIVPERCTIEIDRRLLPGEHTAEALAELDAVIAEIHAARPHLKIEREDPFGDVAGLDTPTGAPIVRALEQASREICGEASIIGVPYGTNASKFAEAGIPCVVFGPGDIRQAHTADEYVAIDQVVTAARILEAAARNF